MPMPFAHGSGLSEYGKPFQGPSSGDIVQKYIVFGFDMETDVGNYLKTYNGLRRGTDRILAVLAKYDIPATFFFVGSAARDNPDTVRAIAAKGLEVGCHGLQHETVGDAGFNMPNDVPILGGELEGRLRRNLLPVGIEDPDAINGGEIALGEGNPLRERSPLVEEARSAHGQRNLRPDRFTRRR